jgi:MFS family permease
MLNELKKILSGTVLVAALGYFVDIYDLVIFSIVRRASLQDLGLNSLQVMESGLSLINIQMFGILLGGILWGVLGDKRGRISVLFGSIFIYSLANIANAFVTTLPAYAFWRFVAGLGLAGELGAAVTLVSEIMNVKQRGYGTTIVASVGLMGAVAAAAISNLLDWRTAYLVGGLLGFILLVMRLKLSESPIFQGMKLASAKKGNFLMLFSDRQRFKRYLCSILIGVPGWFIAGILITFAGEFAKVMGTKGIITAGGAVLFFHAGMVLGDLTSGCLSQILRSRKKVMMIFLAITYLFILIYLYGNFFGTAWFYALCACMGFGNGYWAVLVTNAAEQFGTNLRATVATTVPNFIRGSLVISAFLFNYARNYASMVNSAAIIATFLVVLAFAALLQLKETYGKELDYLEE